MEFHYIDIHSHILPDLDDGAESMAETMEMLKLACEHGTREIVATPHFGQRRYMQAQSRRREVFREVCAQIAAAGLPLKLYLGNEIYYERSGMKCIEEALAETMAGTRYVLVEYSTEVDYQTILGSVRSIRQSGHSAIIAHVERYKCLTDREDLINMLIEQGAYIQVNATSVYKGGLFSKRRIKKLLDAELVHFIASDAHDAHERRPELDKCAHHLLKHYDEAYVKKLLWGNPKKMLRDEYIDE